MYKRNDNKANNATKSLYLNGDGASDMKSSPTRNKSATLASRDRERVNNSKLAASDVIDNKSNANKTTKLAKSSNFNGSSSVRQRRAIARERWAILKKAILNKNGSFKPTSSSSKRRFNSFGFIKSVKIAYNDDKEDGLDHNNNNATSNYRNSRCDTSEDDDDNDDVCFSSKPKTNTKMTSEKRIDFYKKNKKREPNNFQWYEISVPSIDPDECVKARFYNGPISLNDMVGFNNTGNICLWPSEEIMTYFCVKNSAIFDNKSVCELGGGMTCLGGLMISKCSKPKEVFLTDGNETSFENLEVICSENEFECSVECCLLQWDKDTNYGDLAERFDYIICADCLFFDEFRDHLCGTIYKLLKMDGMCLIFAPNRQNTFHKFVDMAKLYFECMIVHDYDMDVWDKHLDEKENNDDYDEDIHYPLLLKLKKRTKTNNDFCKMVL